MAIYVSNSDYKYFPWNFGWLFLANCTFVSAFWLIFWELNYTARYIMCYYYPIRNTQMEFPKIACETALWPGAQTHWLLFLDNWCVTSSLHTLLFHLQKRPAWTNTLIRFFFKYVRLCSKWHLSFIACTLLLFPLTQKNAVSSHLYGYMEYCNVTLEKSKFNFFQINSFVWSQGEVKYWK